MISGIESYFTFDLFFFFGFFYSRREDSAVYIPKCKKSIKTTISKRFVSNKGEGDGNDKTRLAFTNFAFFGKVSASRNYNVTRA